MNAPRTDTSPSHRGLALFVGGVGLVVSWALSSVVLREYRMWQTDVRLTRDGVGVEGRIETKRIERRSRGTNKSRTYVNVHWLHYSYTTGTGERIEGQRTVPEGVFRSYDEGDTLGIRIDPDRPDLNCPEFADGEREWEIGYSGVLACISLVLTVLYWVLILLYLTGRISSQQVLNLFTADLSGREASVGASPTGKPPEPKDEIGEVEEMVRTGRKLEAIKLLRKTHNMGLKEAREFVDEFGD